jgi:hypothetical protein
MITKTYHLVVSFRAKDDAKWDDARKKISLGLEYPILLRQNFYNIKLILEIKTS